MHSDYNWPVTFREIYDRGMQRYQAGCRSAGQLFEQPETEFLATLGCSVQELFDFVEDAVQWGEPAFETVLLMTAARRDYFLTVQGGSVSSKRVDMAKLPPKDQPVDGIPWLPRIIVKARAKLRGEMPPELMYCCGGDRQFLQEFGIEPADFLRFVWAAGDDDRKVVEYVKGHRSKR